MAFAVALESDDTRDRTQPVDTNFNTNHQSNSPSTQIYPTPSHRVRTKQPRLAA